MKKSVEISSKNVCRDNLVTISQILPQSYEVFASFPIKFAIKNALFLVIFFTERRCNKIKFLFLHLNKQNR